MDSAPFLQIVCAAAGLVAGSIIVFSAPRLVAHRVPQAQLAPPRVLIPVIGVLWARWRPLYGIAIELVTAALFVTIAFRFGASQKLVLACMYTVLLVTIAYIDLDHRLVLNRLSYPGTVLALGGSVFWSGIGISSALLGAATGLAIFLAFQLLARGAFGAGDIKLAFLIGAMRGFPGALNALLLGTFLGGLGALFFLLVLRKGRKASIAYGPYLSAGAILSFLLANP